MVLPLAFEMHIKPSLERKNKSVANVLPEPTKRIYDLSLLPRITLDEDDIEELASWNPEVIDKLDYSVLDGVDQNFRENQTSRPDEPIFNLFLTKRYDEVVDILKKETEKRFFSSPDQESSAQNQAAWFRFQLLLEAKAFELKGDFTEAEALYALCYDMNASEITWSYYRLNILTLLCLIREGYNDGDFQKEQGQLFARWKKLKRNHLFGLMLNFTNLCEKASKISSFLSVEEALKIIDESLSSSLESVVGVPADVNKPSYQLVKELYSFRNHCCQCISPALHYTYFDDKAKTVLLSRKTYMEFLALMEHCYKTLIEEMPDWETERIQRGMEFFRSLEKLPY